MGQLRFRNGFSRKVGLDWLTIHILVPVWIEIIVRLRFLFHISFLFYFLFFQRMNSKITWIYCAGDNYNCSRTVAALFMHLKILKMGLTVVFTHLKIILLQCFQFSVSTKISCIQTDPQFISNLLKSIFFYIGLRLTNF